MGTLEQVRSARRLARWGIVIGYVLAVGALVIGVVNPDPRVASDLMGLARAVGVAGVLSIAPTVALLALHGRPRLLPAAAAVAVSSGILALSFMGLLELLPALLWANAFGRWPRPVQTRWREIILWPALVIASFCAFLALFVYQNPMCTRTYADGVVETGIAEGGGWIWAGDSGLWTGHGTVTGGSDGNVESEECTSDVVTWLEALVCLGLSAGTVAVAAWGGAQRRA